MAESAPSSSSPDPTSPEEIIQALRRELIAGELQRLELQDRLVARDTDRADAVALLGQAELVLEEKIGYILQLDHSLNQRIRELEAECDRKTAEIDRRGELLSSLRAEADQQRSERDAIIKDLNVRLESANQEISRAHELAGDFAAKFNRCEQALTALQDTLRESQSVAATTQQNLIRNQEDLDAARARMSEIESALQTERTKLSNCAAALVEAQASKELIRSSWLWRLSRPWRAFFGPEL